MNDPLIKTDGITLSWSYDEEVTSVCRLYRHCFRQAYIVYTNIDLLTIAHKGYSLSVEGTDLEDNTAAGPV